MFSQLFVRNVVFLLNLPSVDKTTMIETNLKKNNNNKINFSFVIMVKNAGAAWQLFFVNAGREIV